MNAKDIILRALTKKTGLIAAIILSIIASVTLNIFAILIVREMVDNVFIKTMSEDPGLALRVTGFCLSLLISFLLGLFVKTQSVALGAYVTTELSNNAYSAILRADMAELEDLPKEELVSKLTKDTSKIGNDYITDKWVNFINNVFTLIGIFITMMIISPILGAVTYILLPVFYMINYTFNGFVNRYTFKANQEIIIQEEKLKEDVQKIRSIKLKNGIIQEEEEFKKNNERYIEIHKKTDLLTDMNKSVLSDLLMYGVLAIVLGLGGYLSTRGQHIPGTIVAFVVMIPLVYFGFRKVVQAKIFPEYIESEIESINELITLKSEIKSEPINSLDEIHSLKFEEVSYETTNGGIDSLSFELKRGEKLGVLSLDDESSNLIFELITKMIRPTEGRISINNCDINKLSTLYLRDIVTAIAEDRTIFNTTVRDNITYPLEFDEYKFNDALNRSGLKDLLLDFPDKDQTIVNDNYQFDSSIIQRINLANAFYKDSKIIVSKESTSSLDIRGEEAIMQEFMKLKNKIIILMSNKTYNVLHCDKILIIDNEKVLEYGKISDLLKDKNSLFSKLIKKVKVTKDSKVS